MSKAIEKYQKLNSNNPLNNTAWDCDIHSVLYETLHEYSEQRKLSPNCLKKAVKNRIIPSSELLHEYLDEIIKENSELNYLKEKIFIRENTQKLPRASVVYSANSFDEYLIVINHNLLTLIYNFFCVFELLPHESVFHNLLKKYHKVVEKGHYGDMELFNNLMWQIRNLYAGNSVSIDRISFYHDPIDLCEKYTAALKFIIAHEIAHIHLKHKAKIQLKSNAKKIEYNIYKRSQEYEADIYALDILLKKFVPNNFLNIDDRFEAVNTLKGVLMLFSLYDYIESFHDWYTEQDDHPNALFREANAFHFLANSDLLRGGDRELGHEMNLSFCLDNILNQICKRVPFRLWDIEVAVARNFSNSAIMNDYRSIDAYYKYESESRSRIELYKLFIGRYVPYTRKKFNKISKIKLNFKEVSFCNSNIPSEVDELKLLIYFNKRIFGNEIAEDLTNYYCNHNADLTLYSDLEYKLLIHTKQIFEEQSTNLGERDLVINKIFNQIKHSN